MRASPDFKSLSEEEALADLRERIGHYERAYESVTDEEGAYIKLYNLSSKVSANQVFGEHPRLHPIPHPYPYPYPYPHPYP